VEVLSVHWLELPPRLLAFLLLLVEECCSDDLMFFGLGELHSTTVRAAFSHSSRQVFASYP
jgi:hypothetical protein